VIPEKRGKKSGGTASVTCEDKGSFADGEVDEGGGDVFIPVVRTECESEPDSDSESDTDSESETDSDSDYEVQPRPTDEELSRARLFQGGQDNAANTGKPRQTRKPRPTRGKGVSPSAAVTSWTSCERPDCPEGEIDNQGVMRYDDGKGKNVFYATMNGEKCGNKNGYASRTAALNFIKRHTRPVDTVLTTVLEKYNIQKLPTTVSTAVREMIVDLHNKLEAQKIEYERKIELLKEQSFQAHIQRGDQTISQMKQQLSLFKKGAKLL
jgi:hypothetical protein